MSLGSSLDKLKKDLASAFDESVQSGIDNLESSEIIKNLSEKISKAIDDYSKKAKIDTDVIVPPGTIIAAPAGPNLAPVTGAGTGKITGMLVSELKSKTEAALKKSTENGALDGADSTAINTDLGTDLSQAILNYYKSSVVETDIELQAFQTSGLPPITPAAIAPGEKGTGTGAGGTSLGLTSLDPIVNSLSSNIASAFDAKVAKASEEGVSTAEVNSELGNFLGKSIHDFITKSVVMTTCIFQGGTGESAPASMMPSPGGPPMPTAPPPMTVPGAIGTGVGKIS